MLVRRKTRRQGGGAGGRRVKVKVKVRKIPVIMLIREIHAHEGLRAAEASRKTYK